MQGEARTGDGREWSDVRRLVACKESQAGDGEQGTRGAHLKHVAHVCHAGRVEAQRLVERRRALPRAKKANAVGEMRAGRREGVRATCGESSVQRSTNWSFGQGHAMSAPQT